MNDKLSQRKNNSSSQSILVQMALHCEITDLFSDKPKDIYNIQARNFAVELQKKAREKSKDFIAVLKRDSGRIDLCVRDIIAFSNYINAKSINVENNLKSALF